MIGRLLAARYLRTLSLALICCACFAGCTLNSNRALPEGGKADSRRAVLVYGVGVEDRWRGTEFPLDLVQYDMTQQKIAGGCFRFNRTETRTASAPAGIRYFAFEVVPGYYALSPFLNVQSSPSTAGFLVAPGSTIYIGEFIYRAGDRIDLVRDLPAAKPAIYRDLPKLAQDLRTAEQVEVAPPRPFMCTP